MSSRQASVSPRERVAALPAHLAQVCTGCHGANLAGGPIPGGDPAWPPSRNLTPHADGLRGWTYDDFTRALVKGVRKNGEPLRQPMAGISAYAANFTETELKALWLFLESVPPAPTPKP